MPRRSINDTIGQDIESIRLLENLARQQPFAKVARCPIFRRDAEDLRTARDGGGSFSAFFLPSALVRTGLRDKVSLRPSHASGSSLLCARLPAGNDFECVRHRNDVGARARLEHTTLPVETEKAGGRQRRGLQRIAERHAAHRHRIAHGRGHVEMRAGKRAIGCGETPAFQRNQSVAEFEARGRRAHRGHRVCDKHDPLGALGRKRRAHRNRIDMETIDDQTRRQALLRERRADDRWRAAPKRRHGIEEMRHRARPFPDRARNGLRGCFAVPDSYANTASDERANESFRYAFGRQRDERMADVRESAQPFEIACFGPGDALARMNAGARRIDERTFEMDAEDAFAIHNARRRRDRDGGLFPRIRDEGGQQRRGAETAMGARDRPDRFRRGCVVEKNAAAAVHLQIDEAGREKYARRQSPDWNCLRNFTLFDKPADAAGFNQHGLLRVPPAAVEHSFGEKGGSFVILNDAHGIRMPAALCNAKAMTGNDLYFTGIDGGGSGCRARIVAPDGKVLGSGTAAPAAVRLGLDRALASVVSAVRAAAADAGLSADSLGRMHAVAGLAGIGRKGVLDKLKAQPHPFRSLGFANDATIACIGAHEGRDGGIVIVGTGSVGLALLNGREMRVGGYGFPISDEGSGADLGLRAIRLALRAHDGRIRATMLTREMMALFHDDPFEAVSWADKATATDYAKLAPLILRHAEAGDHVGRHVLKYAAQEIDALVRRLVSYGAVRIALLGGVAPRMAPFLAGDVRAYVVPSRGDAIDGALLLARRGGSTDRGEKPRSHDKHAA